MLEQTCKRWTFIPRGTVWLNYSSQWTSQCKLTLNQTSYSVSVNILVTISPANLVRLSLLITIYCSKLLHKTSTKVSSQHRHSLLVEMRLQQKRDGFIKKVYSQGDKVRSRSVIPWGLISSLIQSVTTHHYWSCPSLHVFFLLLSKLFFTRFLFGSPQKR